VCARSLDFAGLISTFHLPVTWVFCKPLNDLRSGGRQEYADGQTVSIETRKHGATTAQALIPRVVWRRSGRRYRLPDLHSNNEYSTLFWGLNWQPR
jgi:hypothetical protein